jgi:uncharacterized protein YcfJ
MDACHRRKVSHVKLALTQPCRQFFARNAGRTSTLRAQHQWWHAALLSHRARQKSKVSDLISPGFLIFWGALGRFMQLYMARRLMLSAQQLGSALNLRHCNTNLLETSMKTTPFLALSCFAAAMAAFSGAAFAQEQGRVISTTPVITQVAVPRQVCANEQVTTPGQQKSGAGAVIGGVAGGVIGNAAGHGNGRAAMTMIGLVGGAILGDKLEGNNAQAQTQNVQRCTTQTFYENRPTAYNVVYEFNGKQYQVQLPQDPGPFVSLQVTPVGGQPVQPTQPAPVIVRPVTQAPVYNAPVYNSPVYNPPVVYTQPVYTQPVVIESYTTYVQPAPVYVRPAPVFVSAAPVYYGRPHYHHPYPAPYRPYGSSVSIGYTGFYR